MQSRGDGALSDDLLYHQQLHADSDDEDDGYLDSDDEEDRIGEQQRLRRKYRNRKPHHLKGQFWGSHQRFFRSLCIASKVDKAVELAKKAVEDGQCCVIGLQVRMSLIPPVGSPCLMFQLAYTLISFSRHFTEYRRSSF